MRSVLLGWGANSYGQLGVGRLCEQCQVPEEVQLPLQLKEEGGVEGLSGGGGHSCVLDRKGNLWTCGWNHKGQCGYTGTASVFKKVTLGEDEDDGKFKVVGMACGWDWTMAWTDLGDVWAAGSNVYGQLGLGMELKNVEQFVQVPGLKSVVKVACGLRHSLVLDRSGQVRGLGNTKKKQLGQESPVSVAEKNYIIINISEEAVDIACGQYFSLVLTRGGKLFGFGDNKFGQIAARDSSSSSSSFEVTLIPSPEPFSSVRTGWTHALGVTREGSVYNWGRNNYGQLGRKSHDQATGKLDLQVRALESGSEHCLAVTKETGELVSWGWNEHGNCGDGSTENILSPSPVALPRLIVDTKYKVVTLNTSSAHNFALLTIDK